MFAGQAPGTSVTLHELCDPERQPSRLTEAIPLEVSRFWPEHQFQLDREKYACNLRAAPRGSAGQVAGDTNEHFKVLLDDEVATLLVTEAAEHLCVADVPGEIADALGLGALMSRIMAGSEALSLATPSAEEWLNNAPRSSKRRACHSSTRCLPEPGQIALLRWSGP